MMELIDKSALITEFTTHNNYEDGLKDGRLIGYKDALNNINNLEKKKVDLKKEFENYTKDILACDVQFEPFTHLYNCAKHFFKLGLKAQKVE